MSPKLIDTHQAGKVTCNLATLQSIRVLDQYVLSKAWQPNVANVC